MSSPCPLSPSFPSACNTSPLKYRLGIPASNYNFDIADHHLLDDKWLNGDASSSHSLLHWAAEMQDEYLIALFSAITLDSPPPSLATRLEPIYKSDEDSPPPAKHSKRAHWSQIMAPPADHWDMEDLANIYGSGAKNDDDGFVCMCLSVLHSLCPQPVVILIYVVVYIYAIKIIATAQNVYTSMRNLWTIGYLTRVLQCT